MKHWKRAFLPVAPMCQGCPHAARCAAQKLACRQFESWVCNGGRGWKKCLREPTRSIFNRVFQTQEQEAA